jgi:peptide/nickel transport system ATP-binding protein
MTAAAPLLSVRDLTTVVAAGGGRPPLPAVNGVSFDVAPGRTLGLVGESGSGKSLTAMSILRLLSEPAVRIAHGEILFDGMDLARTAERDLRRIRGRRIAMIFQEPSSALNPVLTIADQVGEPLRVHQGLSRKAAAARAVGLLEQVGIPAAAERARAYPHQLSGGMKQRAMIAMALACRPALLIADEPTTALDVTVQAQILALLGRLRRELDMAMILITHDLGVVAEICDDVAVMYAGRIVEQAAVSELFRHPRHPYTLGLMRAMPKAESTDPDPGPAAAAPERAGPTTPPTRPRLQEIPGVVPPLGALPPGCSFAARCPAVTSDCRTAVPSLTAARGARPDDDDDDDDAANDDDDGAHPVACVHPQPDRERERS